MLSKNFFKYAVYSSISIIGLYFMKKIENQDLRMGMVGLLGQVTTDLFFHPLDLVNTRTKYYFKEKINSIDMSKRILSTTGWRGLYRAGSVTFLGSSFSGFVYFSSYKKLKDLFKKVFDGEAELNYVVYTLSSILSELCIYPLYYPFDLVKTRIQTGQYAYKNFFDGVKKIYLNSKRTGISVIKDFYTGFSPSFIFNLSSTFLVFFTFEITRDYIAKKKNIKNDEVVGFDYFFCSFMAGFVTAATLNFLEVYSIQKVVHGDEITFKKFLSAKNFYAIKSGLMARMISGIFYTIFLLESINFYGKILKAHI